MTRGGFVETNKALARLFEVLASYFRSSLSIELEMSKTANMPTQMLHMANRVDVRDKFHALIESCEQQLANVICSNFLEDAAQI